jgi:hypothetical protein
MIKSRRMRFEGHAARMEKKRNAYKISVGNPVGKRPQGKSRLKWEDNIRMDFREKGWGGMDLIDLVQDRNHWRALLNTAMNFRVQEHVGNFLRCCATGGF